MKRTILIVALLLSSNANAAILQFNFGGEINAVAPNPSLTSFAVGDLWNATIFVETNNPIEAIDISTYAVTNGAYNLGSFAFDIDAEQAPAFLNNFILADPGLGPDTLSSRQFLVGTPANPLPTVNGNPYNDVTIQLFDVDSDVFTGTSISQILALTIADFVDGNTGTPLGIVNNNLYFGGPSGAILTGTINSFSAASVPVPAAVWLLGSALVGLLGIARRKVIL